MRGELKFLRSSAENGTAYSPMAVSRTWLKVSRSLVFLADASPVLNFLKIFKKISIYAHLG